MLQEPTPTPYDVQFQVLGFPVRISWGFWLMAFIFGYSWVQALDLALGELSLGILPMMLLWTLCLFVSILIHELGHAFAFRQSGIESSIVLYHFGGLAIPRSGSRGYERLSEKENLWISFAGPLFQFASALIVIAIVKATGYRLADFDSIYRLPIALQDMIDAGSGENMLIDSVGLFALTDFYLFPSIFWAVLNLIPVLPLDGGQIAGSLNRMRGGNMRQTLWISVIAAGLVAFYGFTNGQRYMGILFLVLGIQSFQQLQQHGQSRY
jgi:Zn-dependent protease